MVIDSRCWVEIISTQHQAIILRIENSLQRLRFRYTLIYGFPRYLLPLKHHNPIHHLSTAGSNSSLRARGHVGCWVEFHPASLSGGWERHFVVKLLWKALPRRLQGQVAFFSGKMTSKWFLDAAPAITDNLCVFMRTFQVLMKGFYCIFITLNPYCTHVGGFDLSSNVIFKCCPLFNVVILLWLSSSSAAWIIRFVVIICANVFKSLLAIENNSDTCGTKADSYQNESY